MMLLPAQANMCIREKLEWERFDSLIEQDDSMSDAQQYTRISFNLTY